MDWSRIEKSPVITGWLRNQIARFGLELLLFRELQVAFENTIDPLSTDTYNSVYGIFAGAVKVPEESAPPPPETIRVLMPASNFSASDDLFESSIVQAPNLYTLVLLHNGDIVGIQRPDGHIFRFKAVQCETLGMESNIITRFRLTTLAGNGVDGV